MMGGVPFSVVVACTPDGGIGWQNHLPWRIPADMKFFKNLTTTTKDPAKRNMLLMGRKTWESLPPGGLPGRSVLVVSRSSGLEQTLEKCRDPEIESVFVVGGAALYSDALQREECHTLYLTRVFCEDREIPVDVTCESLRAEELKRLGFRIKQKSIFHQHQDYTYQFCEYERDRKRVEPPPHHEEQQCLLHEEQQYLQVVSRVLAHGVKRMDRTQTGTLSTFGVTMRFSLRNGCLPLLTTKKVFWRGVVAELLWFISGKTNVRVLAAQGVNIWNENTSRETLDRLGFKDRPEFDLGPSYPWQWRHYGAPYKDMNTPSDGLGIDQLQQLIEGIRRDPYSRRHVLCSWNVAQIAEMSLPPCHCFVQFYVAENRLSCSLLQRSCDLGLGFGFNVASYALLTHMIAHLCDLEADEFVHYINDAHVYCNHIEALQEQIQRTPYPFPTLRFRRRVTNIDDFTAEDIQLENYRHHAPVVMKMSV